MPENRSETRGPFRSVRDDSVPRVEEFQPAPLALAAAVGAVAATYVYFLIFAQFGFLKVVQAAPGGAAALLQPVMAVMGLGGLAGSALVAWRFERRRAQAFLTGGFAVAGAAALLALVARTPALLFATAALTGLGTGTVTVALAATLRPVLGGARLGRCIGLGTGLAYGLCNLPGIFNATGTGQAVFGAAAACCGVLAAQAMELRAPSERSGGPDYAPGGIAGWVLVFFALVWLDSAAFYVIQHTPSLQQGTWGDGRLYANAAVHLGAAVLAGYALDRRWVGRTVLAGAVLLVVAGELIGESRQAFAQGALLYTAGVSVYSAALVFYPARNGRPWLAALVYGVAGWIGSGLGIGMAENLHDVPRWFLAAAGVVIAGALAVRWLGRRATAGAALALAVGGAGSAPEARAQDAATVAFGRAVYVREGCTACHSQFIRPVTGDIERWGPRRPLAEALAQVPPLIGYRRQGPDLQNLAARRTREWNRLHLVAPRDLSPGSRMPSYAHLFAGGTGEGEALLAYLDTLGSDAVPDRWTAAQAWRPGLPRRPPEPGEPARLYNLWCAACHGPGGRGDGPLATHLLLRPRDLTAEPWRFVPAGEDEALALARIIKFGAPGTAMAGREYLPDADIAALAAYVRALRAAGQMNKD